MKQNIISELIYMCGRNFILLLKIFLQRKLQAHEVLLINSVKQLRIKQHQFSKIFQKIEQGEILPNQHYEINNRNNKTFQRHQQQYQREPRRKKKKKHNYRPVCFMNTERKKKNSKNQQIKCINISKMVRGICL